MNITYGSDALAILHHPCVISSVVVDFLLDRLVLAEQLLRVGQRRRDVFRRDVRLGLLEPALEMIQVPEEPVKVSGFFQLGVSLFQLEERSDN